MLGSTVSYYEPDEFEEGSLKTAYFKGEAGVRASVGMLKATKKPAIQSHQFTDDWDEDKVKGWCNQHFPTYGQEMHLYDPSQERDDQGRWTDEGGGRESVWEGQSHETQERWKSQDRQDAANKAAQAKKRYNYKVRHGVSYSQGYDWQRDPPDSLARRGYGRGLSELRYFSTAVLAESVKVGQSQVLRTGRFFHPKYGQFTVTEEDLDTMVRNFAERRPKRPTELVVDYEHQSESGQIAPAAGWIKGLEKRGQALYMTVEWTDGAANSIRAKEYRFISPAFNMNYTDKETGQDIGPTLLAAALTNRPFLEGMEPVVLSEELEEMAFALSESMTNMILYDPGQERDEFGRWTDEGGGEITPKAGQRVKINPAYGGGYGRIGETAPSGQFFQVVTGAGKHKGYYSKSDLRPVKILSEEQEKQEEIADLTEQSGLLAQRLASLKGIKASELLLAEWDAQYVNDLPDASFAYVAPGGEKDESGRTVPRSLRHLPFRNADGAVDLPHLRNALARLGQTDIPAEAKEKARRVLEAAASKEGVGEDEDKKLKEVPLEELLKLLGLEPGSGMDAVIAKVKSLLTPPEDVKAKEIKLTETEAKVATLTSELAEAKKTILGKEAGEAVAKAIVDRKLLPAQKEWATSLYLSDKASFESFVKVAPAVGPEMGVKGAEGEGDGDVQLSETEIKLAEQMRGGKLTDEVRASLIATKKALADGSK